MSKSDEKISMKQFFIISNLSKYRTQLMGFAILWVICFHFGFGTFQLPLINFVIQTGYGGVDLFLFLSGLGIYYSLSKDENIKSFYLKRLLRIFPYYIPVVLIVMICNEKPIALIFLNILTLSFWINSSFQFDWYIPALIFLYLITPFYYLLFKRKPLSVTFAITLLSVLLSFFAGAHFNIFIIRMPVYFIGFLFGFLIGHNYLFDKRKVIISLLIGTVGICWLYYNFIMLNSDYLWKTGLWWYPFILVTFPALLVVSGFLSLFKRYHFPVLTFFGKYSLVMYLLHWNILPALRTIRYFEKNKIIARVAALILTCTLGYFFQNIIEKGMAIIAAKQQKATLR